jgi:hypothetical protein
VSDVDDYLAGLSHAELPGILRLRAAILAADARLVERIKWNAPSFGLGADELVTMRLAPRDAFQLVFHRGVAKVEGAVTIDDPEGLLEWRAADRAVLDLRTSARAAELEPAIVALVRAWVAAVT